ncbi:hypothetical protein [Paludibacterium denitrificans]|uniref:Uncharacterized protein n=1 Tax=Paludibacterium denitrificans TaxID=2675226 RepID=A0A844G812_9NEIS|nr:hypothetical protein [Paludibacterium denitrificans]MTD32443.1 hypothetical protein [Paludibacterium denitrificans]
MIKLQVNNSGARKDIVSSAPDKVDTLKSAASQLGSVAAGHVKFRLVEAGTLGRVLGYSEAPDFAWSTCQ